MHEIELTSTHDGRDLRPALSHVVNAPTVPRTNHDPQQVHHTEEKTDAYQSP